MGWNIEEEPKKKNGTDKTLKVLMLLIILLIFTVVGIIAALYTIKNNTLILSVDGQSKKYSDKLIKEYNGATFYNVQELAQIIGYDFHIGEYKEYAKDTDKCYIINTKEASSFYLNSDKVCNINVGDYTEEYKVFDCSYNTTKIDEDFYAPKDAIEIAFDISII